MKQVFHKTVSMLMAFVVLFSTMSFTIDMHYCGDTLIDTSIFKQAKTCGMEQQKPSTETDCAITKKNCCSDEQLVVDGQNELQLSVDKIAFQQQLFIATFVHTYIALFESVKEKEDLYKDYTQPLVVRELYKLDETYLI